MITWIQTSFGRHHKWILVAVLAVVMISFVFTIGAVPHGQASSQSGAPRIFLGVNVNDQAEMEAVGRATAMWMAWQGHQARTNDEMESAVQQRLALLHLADTWQIPLPTEAQQKEYIQTLAIFKNEAGVFDANRYQQFVDGVQTQAPEMRDLVADTMAQNWRIDRVLKIVCGPGYALPFSAEIQASLIGTTWNLDVASLDYAKFEPKVDASDAVLQTLYNRDPSRFEVPAQLRLSYVHFTAPPSTATPTAADLKDYMTANAKDFPDVKQPDQLDAKTTAAATTAWRQAQGAREAEQQASNFVQALAQLNLAQGTPAFDALVKKFNVQAQDLAPVVAGKPAPADSPVPDAVLQQAAPTLNPQHFYSDPARVPDGAVVLFFKEIIPAHVPPFAEARADVAAVYKAQEKAKQFDARGKELQAALAKAVAAGQNFKDAATALGLTFKNFPAVTFTDPPADMSYELQAALANPEGAGVPFILTLQAGQVSPMVTTEDEGAFLHIIARTTPPLSADLPATKTALRTIETQEGDMTANAIIAPIINAAARTLNQGG
jgi:peptidyl-prolyl cis-trans isomerase D